MSTAGHSAIYYTLLKGLGSVAVCYIYIYKFLSVNGLTFLLNAVTNLSKCKKRKQANQRDLNTDANPTTPRGHSTKKKPNRKISDDSLQNHVCKLRGRPLIIWGGVVQIFANEIVFRRPSERNF